MHNSWFLPAGLRLRGRSDSRSRQVSRALFPFKRITPSLWEGDGGGGTSKEAPLPAPLP